MGVIELDHVISFSSQDDNFRAENLLVFGRNPWLSAPEDKSGRIEVEFKLKMLSCIDYIDIGNMGSSLVEVQVGKSKILPFPEYKTLLPPAPILTPDAIKRGHPHNTVIMFNKLILNKCVVDDLWDQVKVVCHQPYRKHVQFGLSFLCLRSDTCGIDIDRHLHPSGTRNKVLQGKQRFIPGLPSYTKKRKMSAEEAARTRGAALVHASKAGRSQSHLYKVSPQPSSSKNISPQESSSTFKVSSKPSSTAEEFLEDAGVFLTACVEDNIEVTSADCDYYMANFEVQSKQKLTLKEKKLFHLKFAEIFHQDFPQFDWDPDFDWEDKLSSEEAVSAAQEVTPTPSPKSSFGASPCRLGDFDDLNFNTAFPMEEKEAVDIVPKIADKNQFQEESESPTKDDINNEILLIKGTALFKEAERKRRDKLAKPTKGKAFTRDSSFLNFERPTTQTKPRLSLTEIMKSYRRMPAMTRRLPTHPSGSSYGRKEEKGGLTKTPNLISFPFIPLDDPAQPSTSSGIRASCPPLQMIQCPICREHFPQNLIETHASTCGLPPHAMSVESLEEGLDDQTYSECPMCQQLFLPNEVERHAADCDG